MSCLAMFCIQLFGNDLGSPKILPWLLLLLFPHCDNIEPEPRGSSHLLKRSLVIFRKMIRVGSQKILLDSSLCPSLPHTNSQSLFLYSISMSLDLCLCLCPCPCLSVSMSISRKLSVGKSKKNDLELVSLLEYQSQRFWKLLGVEILVPNFCPQ